MVAYFLTTKARLDRAIWPLLLMVSLGGSLCAEEGRAPVLDLGGSVSEEDLPAEEAQTLTPAEPADSTPTVPQPPTPVEVPSLNNSPPSLPTNAALSAQDLVALRFVEAGKDALGQEDFDQARERFEKAVAVAPFQPYGYYFLGRVAFARGEHKQALAFLHKAELLFAHDNWGWLGEAANLKGAVYEDLGDYAQARVAYLRCLQLVPHNLSALSALARLPVEEPLPSETLPE
jgi:tetratricopeptide (TPR) repeat protein